MGNQTLTNKQLSIRSLFKLAILSISVFIHRLTRHIHRHLKISPTIRLRRLPSFNSFTLKDTLRSPYPTHPALSIVPVRFAWFQKIVSLLTKASLEFGLTSHTLCCCCSNMAIPGYCHHSFNLLKSESTLIQWVCSMCHSGPHWYIFECKYCKLKTCRPCTNKV